MAEVSILGKHQIEKALHDERREISSGRLKEENPLDNSVDFRLFCEACRRGDLKLCQEQIGKGVNINARDEFDYTPLILASLCGHYEVVQMLLEQGALCERDTFQGERCLYNALNDRIRNLLLSYDYSKSTDPLQPLAAHILSLLMSETPTFGDIAVQIGDTKFQLHKFVLSARSPYFAKKLAASPEMESWKVSSAVPTQSFDACIRYLYLGDALAPTADNDTEQEAIMSGIDRLSRLLKIPQLFGHILNSGDRRQARQRRTEEVERGRDQLATWYKDNILRNKLEVETSKVDEVKWDRSNGIFADILLRADEDEIRTGDDCAEDPLSDAKLDSNEYMRTVEEPLNGIPVGNFQSTRSRSLSRRREVRKSVLFPAHRAMLLRSELFATMFASPFREAQESQHLHIVPVDCTPEVLEVILTFIYTEKADFSLPLALDVLHAADMLFIDKLKQRAALLISTLGNGSASIVEAENPRGETSTADSINVYDVVRAGWDTRVHRLEEFGARYIAYRLERYIDEPEFKDLVRESASRIQSRQETDTVELVDDIRYFLSERFRLRFEDAGLDEMMDENPDQFVREEEIKHDVKQNAEIQHDEVVEARGGLTPPQVLHGTASTKGEAFTLDIEDLDAPGVVRTLDGEIAGDEFAQDAINYRILLGKIDHLMETLGLDG